MITGESSNISSLFFASFAVVFSREEDLRPWVPYESAKILWEQLKISNYVNDLGQQTRYTMSTHELLENLRKIGVVNVDMRANFGKIEDRKYRVNHDLMWQYGRQCASLLNQHHRVLNESKVYSWLPSLEFLGLNYIQVENQKDTTKIEWNALLADQYQTYIDEPINDENNKIVNIVFSMLPSHMMNALQLNEVFSFLVNEGFVKKRLSKLGLEDGIIRHIADIEKLHKIVSAKNEMLTVQCSNNSDFSTSKFSAIYCLNCIAEILWKIYNGEVPVNHCENVHQAMIQVGRALQKYSSWIDAIGCFTKALEMCHTAGFEDNHVDIARILKLIECSSLKKSIVLVPIKSPERLILKNAHILRHQNEEVLLELSSHPEHSIAPMGDKFENTMYHGPVLELVFGPKENSVCATYDGDFITRVDDGAVLNVAHGSFVEGVSVVLKPGPRTPREREKHKKIMNRSRCFIINSEGSISPLAAPFLAIGISPYSNLRLIKRNSPNRAIFKNAKSLIECQLELKKTNNKIISDGIDLELLSHPGCSLVQTHGWIDVGSFSAARIGVGPNHETLKVHFLQDGQIILHGREGFITVFGRRLIEGGSICLFKKVPFWYKYCYLKQQGSFTINNDGSISPTYAPHLVISPC